MDSSLLTHHYYADMMLTHIPVGVALFDAQHFHLLSVNRLYENFLDTFLEPEWRHGRALGHTFTEWLPDAEAIGITDIFRAVAATGKPYQGDEYAFPAFSCGITYWQWTIDPIYDDTHQIVHLLQIINNITPQVLARQQIEQHETVLQQLPEGVLIVEGASDTISYANDTAAAILDIPIHNLVGLPLHQYQYFQSATISSVNEQSLLSWTSAIVRALGGETVSSQESVVIKPNGAAIVILSSSAPLRSETGSITGAVIVFQDVTAQKSLEQQKNEFLSIASHELRTPITAIQGFAEILQMQMERNQQFSTQSQRALDIIIEQSQCLSRLIEEMLDVTRIENMRLRLNIQEHDFLKTLTHILDTQAGSNLKHSLRLVLEGLQATDTLPMYYDEDRVVQIFNNLISNAVKYSTTGSAIEVGLRYARQTDCEVLCWVKDQGIGISANELPHIFERFHRASTIDRSISGLGLGLYLVKELVTLHQGEVWAESTEGQGTTIFVRLPLYPVEKQA
jgi:signal transduction histidine kinase